MDAPGYADLAARRRELLTHRLEARKDIGEDRLQGQEGLESSQERASAEGSEQLRNSWRVDQQFSRQSDVANGDEDSPLEKT